MIFSSNWRVNGSFRFTSEISFSNLLILEKTSSKEEMLTILDFASKDLISLPFPFSKAFRKLSL